MKETYLNEIDINPPLDSFITSNPFNKVFDHYKWFAPIYMYVTEFYIGSPENDKAISELKSAWNNIKAEFNKITEKRVLDKKKKMAEKERIRSTIINSIEPFNNNKINSLTELNKNKKRIRSIHKCNRRWYMNKYNND